MPVIHAITPKLKIHVYADEHAPTHFHVSTPDGEAQIWLDTLLVKENNGVNKTQIRLAIAWAESNSETLRAKFNELNPEIAK
jgi:hypothetical protein